MTEIAFGRLVELPLREAWKHEALEFTPWLAENIGHLSESIGMSLELTGQEVRVETFAADILARNRLDDSIVLIENQLEPSDHTHLGQIMTYLAGLDAKSVVWIAPGFREPHLSAIRWLNENTADGFSFFAVKARVVRIGESPFAPTFEVVERPNLWERQLEQYATGHLSTIRKEYWKRFVNLLPNRKIWQDQNERFCFLDSNEEFALTLDANADEAWAYLSYEGDETVRKSILRSKIKKLAPQLANELPEKFNKDEMLFFSTPYGLRTGPRQAEEFHLNQVKRMTAAFSIEKGLK